MLQYKTLKIYDSHPSDGNGALLLRSQKKRRKRKLNLIQTIHWLYKEIATQYLQLALSCDSMLV